MMSESQSLTTSTYALSSTNIALHMDGRMFVPHAVLGDTKVSAVSRNGKDIFVGIATTREVQGYLDGVRHATFRRMMGDQPLLTDHPGVAPATAPGDTDIWAAKSSGPGRQTVVWPPRNGDWSVVVMNADGSAGVSVGSRAGAEVPALAWVVTIMLALATIALVAGALLIALPLLSVSRQKAQPR